MKKTILFLTLICAILVSSTSYGAPSDVGGANPPPPRVQPSGDQV